MAETSVPNEICYICDAQDDTVLDGVCEVCEPIWLRQIGVVSKQVPEETSIAYVFEQAAKLAKEIVSNNQNR